MADIINLRQARKARKRQDANAVADANRARFGETLSERKRRQAESDRGARQLDGAQRDREQSPEPNGEVDDV